MKKILLLSLSALFLGGTMNTSAQIYMAAGQENNNKQINFQDVRTLKLNNTSQEEILFAKSILQPQRVQADAKDCGCDLSSPSYIAATTLNIAGDIVTANMLGTKIFITRQNGTVQTLDIEKTASSFTEQGLFARMGTTPDGSIYMLNNIGDQLIKLTTDEQIVHLGAVEGFAEIFAENENKRAQYGGDIIADTEGNLYVFTAFGYVVKIDMKTTSAELVGQITGLPEGYTVNGVAVSDDNTIVLASSQPAGIYSTDINSLGASFVVENTTPTYDLASKYFLKTKPEGMYDNLLLSISPTLVKRYGSFNIDSNTEINNANIAIYGTDGKLALQYKKNIDFGKNTVSINNIVPGVYFVTVSDLSGSKLLNGKIVVE